jgi:hypothetical protein
MALIKPPKKPFPNYKWRWAELTPSESLNIPPVFLGILRVCNKFQNQDKSSIELTEGVNEVLIETNSPIKPRKAERNIFRNSDRYWKALGLLDNVHGKILLTPFGQLLATGRITQVEFATTVVKTLELPNKRIVENTTDWNEAGLKIKPLELILDILVKLAEKYDSSEAYITPVELVNIIIPLAGIKPPLENYPDAIIQYRKGKIDISKWPDCAPSSNDKRIAREFLLFLANYGFCNVIQTVKGNKNEKYFLAGISKEEVGALHKLKFVQQELDKFVKTIRETQIPANVERKRVSIEVLERPFQSIFRKNILKAFNSTCIVTGASIENVLEASHIIDVRYHGSDKVENGLCLRSDIHQLFDSRHLRLLPTGEIILSEIAAAKNNYSKLPRQINIPDFINKDHLNWRIKYT